MIRAGTEANVAAAGIATRCTVPVTVIDCWRVGAFELVVSAPNLAEVGRAWQRRYDRTRVSSEQIERAFTLQRAEAVVTPIVAQIRGDASHPEDDPIWAAAVSAGAGFVVTGDEALLPLRAH